MSCRGPNGFMRLGAGMRCQLHRGSFAAVVSLAAPAGPGFLE